MSLIIGNPFPLFFSFPPCGFRHATTKEGGSRRNSKQRTHHCHDDELRLAAVFFFGGSFLHKNTHIAQRDFFGVFRGEGGGGKSVSHVMMVCNVFSPGFFAKA